MDTSRHVEIGQLLEDLGYWYDSTSNRFEPLEIDSVSYDPDSFLTILAGHVAADELCEYIRLKTFQQDTDIEETAPSLLPRPWAISRRCLRVSLVLAGVAELTFLAAIVVNLLSSAFDPGPIAFSLLWPAVYASYFAICYWMAIVDQQGPVVERFPRWYRKLMPPVAQRTLHWTTSIMQNAFLLIVPLFGLLMAGAMLWAVCGGKLIP